MNSQSVNEFFENNSSMKFILFREEIFGLHIQVEPYLHLSMGQVSLPDLANKTCRREGGIFKLIQRYLTQGFFEIIFMEFNKKKWIGGASESI